MSLLKMTIILIFLIFVSCGKNEKKPVAFNTIELLETIEKGDNPRARQLLMSGANPDYMGNEGWGPIHIAAGNGNIEGVKMLVDFGADVNRKGWDRWSSLHLASEGNHLKIAELLLKNGADPNAHCAGRMLGGYPLNFAYEKSMEDVLRQYGATKIQKAVNRPTKEPEKEEFLEVELLEEY